MFEEFNYSGVPLGARGGASIRVVELLPGTATEMLQLNLKVIPLENIKCPPNFEALSYCWGGTKDAASPITVQCNNQNLVIHSSLNIALRHLRYTQKPRIIWADAICINQKDDDEKAEQIPLMRKIYEKAKRVVIWLGEDGPDEVDGSDSGKRAFGLAGLLVKAYNEQLKGPPKEILDLSRRVPGVEWGPKGKLIKDPWDDFVKLLERPWVRRVYLYLIHDVSNFLVQFGRVWIIQELSVSSDAIFECGDATISWGDFLIAVHYFTSTPTLEMLFPVGSLQFKQVTGLFVSFDSFKHLGGQGILELLKQHRSCDATLAKDKFFALHGIANDCGTEILDLELDYRLDTKDVYIEIALAILLRSADLDILAVPRVVAGLKLSEGLELPSWVPNWSNCNLAESFGEKGLGFVASRETISQVKIVKFSKLGKPSVVVSKLFQTHEAVPQKILELGPEKASPILGISGFVLDKVVEIGALWDLKPTTTPFLRVPEAQNIYNSWEKVAKACSKFTYEATNELILDVYYRCLQATNPPGEFENSSAERQQVDRSTRRFRLLHKTGIQKHKKTNLIASWGLMMYEAMTDVYRQRPSGSLAAGLLLTRVENRRMFRTETGYIGIGPQDMLVGDLVSLFAGSKVPLVVRSEEVLLELVGDCYLHGVMAGEAFNEEKCKMMWFK